MSLYILQLVRRHTKEKKNTDIKKSFLSLHNIQTHAPDNGQNYKASWEKARIFNAGKFQWKRSTIRVVKYTERQINSLPAELTLLTTSQ